MSKSQNYYDLLGVQTNASKATIQFAYKQLVKLHHPDANYGKSPARIKECEQLMKQYNEAYNTLYDDNQRINYDRSLSSSENSKYGYQYSDNFNRSGQPHIVWEVSKDFWNNFHSEFVDIDETIFEVVDWNDLEYELEQVKAEIIDAKEQYDEVRWQLMILDENYADHPSYFARRQEFLHYLRQIKNYLRELKFRKRELKQQIREQSIDFDEFEEDDFG